MFRMMIAFETPVVGWTVSDNRDSDIRPRVLRLSVNPRQQPRLINQVCMYVSMYPIVSSAFPRRIHIMRIRPGDRGVVVFGA
jgi:hypothetical protein